MMPPTSQKDKLININLIQIFIKLSFLFWKTEFALLAICFMCNIILREVKKIFHFHTHMETVKEINLLRRQHTQFEKKSSPELAKERKERR